MGRLWIQSLLVALCMIKECKTLSRIAQHRCDEDPSSATNIISTLKILLNDDPFDSVYGFAADGDVTSPADRIDACKYDKTSGAGVTNVLTDPITITITVDTTGGVAPDCGGVVSTITENGGTVTVVDFMFYVYASLGLETTSDATLTYRCRLDDLNSGYISTDQVTPSARPPVVVPQPQNGAWLTVRSPANNDVPVINTVIGDNVILAAGFVAALQKGDDNCGSRFYIGLLGNDAIPPATSAQNLYIMVVPTLPVRTDVRVTAGGNVISLPAMSGETLTFKLDPELMGCSDGGVVEHDTKGIEIYAFHMEVCVVVFSSDTGTEEYYTALPVSSTGTEYLVNNAAMSCATCTSELMIIASEDATSVSLHLPPGAPDTDYEGTTFSAGSTITINMDQRDSFHIAQAADFSNYRVTSDKTVSVVVGNQNYKGNHLVEQIMPTERLGNQYVLAFMRPSIATTGSEAGWTTVYRLLATVSGTTTVKQYTGASTYNEISLAYGDAPHELVIDETNQCEIEADNPISVTMLSLPPDGSASYMPAMLAVPSLYQMTQSYKIQGPDYDPSQAVLNLFAVHKTEVTAVGRSTTTPSTYDPALGDTLLGPSGYKVTRNIILPPNDQWSFYSSDQASLFMAYALVHGLASPMSALFLPFNLYYAIFGECKTGGKAGSGADLDCDGRIGEDPVDGIDNDGDGDIDEDPRAHNNEIVGVVAIRPISCKVSAESSFPASSLTYDLTGDDGCAITGSRSFFALGDEWAPKTAETGEKIGDNEEAKILYTGAMQIAKFFGYPKLYFKCDVQYCYTEDNTDCTTSVCQPAARRRRQAESDSKKNITTEVYVSATIKKDAGETEPTSVTSIADPSVQDCLQNTAIVAAGGLMLGLCLLAILTACCFCFMLKGRWKFQSRKKKRPLSSRFSTTGLSHIKRRY